MTRIGKSLSLLSTAVFIAACGGSTTEENQNAVPAYCTYSGFEPVTKLAFWDHPWYDFILMSGLSTDEPVTYLDMQFYKDYGSKPQLGVPGKVAIDVDPNDCGTCLILQTNCVDGLCEELYFAGEGDFEVSEWGQTGENFSGSLKNAVFFQIEKDTNGYYKYKDDGKIWCVPDYRFSTTVQSVYELE